MSELTRELRLISLASVVVSPLNTRKNMEAGTEDGGIDELARSIETNGLMQPPSLRELADATYEVVAGQRRVLACQRLGWTHIDAFVVEWNDEAAVSASLVENLQRAEMHPLDKARGLSDLAKRLGSEQAAGKATGLAASTVRKYVSLLDLPEDLRARLGTSEGPTGIGAMAALARSFGTPDEQRQAFELVGSFKGGTAETLLRRSGGNLGELSELRERALEGEFDVHRCGADLEHCPWLSEVPDATRAAVLVALRHPR